MKFLKSLILSLIILFPSLVFGAADYIPEYLTDLSGDVSISSPQDNQVLTYNSSTKKWDNEAVSAGAESDPVVGAITGLVKANGAGVISAASAGTDYIAPYGSTTAKYFLAAPNASDGTPTFRAILASDIPALSYQPADADLTTYAGITPSANAQTLLGQTFAQDQASLSIDHLITLSGMAESSDNLSTFTGTTIADNVTIKAGLQALETAVEGKQASGSYLLATSIDTSAELVTILTDETGSATGTPLLVFNQNPTINGMAGTGVIDMGGATSTEIVNGANPTCDTAGEIAINTTDKTLELNNGTAQVAFSTLHIAQGTFDLKSQYAVDPDLWLIDLHADQYPHGIYITKIYVDASVADPTTELNANLNYCDATSAAFPGANPTLIKAIDTTTGNFADAAVNTAIATGKSIYITMDADPTDANVQYHIRIHYYIPTA